MNLMPDSVTAKVATLARAAADALSLAQSSRAEADDLETQKHAAAQRRKFAAGNRDADAVEAAEAELAKATAALDVAQSAHMRRRDNAHLAQSTLTAVRSWLEMQERPGRVIEALDPVPAKVLQGETISEAILRVRGEIRDAEVELSALAAMPPGREDMQAQIVAEVQRLAQRGRPSVAVVNGAVTVRWPLRTDGSTVTAPEVFAALFPDVTQELLLSLLPDSNGGALSEIERSRRTKEMKCAKFELERVEEALIVEALAQGVAVSRRPDASPAAILNARTTKAARVAA
jgi:hypothetical protein